MRFENLISEIIDCGGLEKNLNTLRIDGCEISKKKIQDDLDGYGLYNVKFDL